MKFRLIFLALGLLALAATVTGGAVYFQTVNALVHAHARKDAQENIEHLDKAIASLLNTNQKAVAALAKMWSVQNFFNRQSPENLAEVKFALDDFREAYNATRCCLLDRNGLVIAASAGEKSPVQIGDDYSMRPFFQKTLAGEPVTALTQGVTSKEPAINLSHPVFSENTVQGVALFTVPLEDIEEEIVAHSTGLVTLTDEHNFVFASNKQEWRFKVLGVATAEELANIAENIRLAGGAPTQLPITFDEDKGTAHFPDGKEYLFSRSLLSTAPGWQINHFREAAQIEAQLYQTLFGKAGILLAGMTLFVFGAMAYLFRQAEVFLRQREAAFEDAHRFAEELAASNDQLHRQQQELALAHDTLKQSQAHILQQEKMASVGQLAAGVAHEINNPMGFISSNLSSLAKYLERLIGFIRALESLPQDTPAEELAALRKKLKIDYIMEDALHLVEESLDGAERVKKIVQGLKNFSRIDQAERLAADINECLDTTLNIIWNELKYKCEVQKNYGELPQTVCNPQQLNQMFMNLLVNAAQAIETKGEIRIKTWADQGWIYTRISDTGCGIPQDKIKRIFEPFYTSKEVGKGTGLGLSIVYDIVVKNHHGDIQVESVEGKGTAFTIKIPVVAAPPQGQ